MLNLTDEEIVRYSRHLMIPEVGMEGQRKLKSASVLIVGAGGLGSPIGMYLAAAGVGHIGIVDFDEVEMSNLQRQILHGTSTLGKLKVLSARRRMLDLNPGIQVDTFPVPFTAENALKISADYDILVDGTDNFPTRYLLNDLGVLTGRPFVYGAVFHFEGQVSVFDSRSGPCYRCLFSVPPPPEASPSCADVGVFGIMPGLIGVLQAAEVVKLILGIGEPLIGKLLLVDALDMSFNKVQLKKDPHCKVCSDEAEITDLVDYEAFCGSSYARETTNLQPTDQITPLELAERLKKGDKLRLIDVRHCVELQISRLPGAENIPYEELDQKICNLDPQEEIVVFCRTGSRSTWAQRILLRAGFSKVWNLSGGINAWGRQVDSTTRLY